MAEIGSASATGAQGATGDFGQGATGATGPGTAAVAPALGPSSFARVGDGLHEHVHLVLTKPPPVSITVTDVHTPILGTPLEIAVFWIALWGLLAAGSAVAFAIVRTGLLHRQMPA
jgi:hypothetical protein